MQKNMLWLSVFLASSLILLSCLDKKPTEPEGLQFYPELISPANGATDVSMNATVSWTCQVPQGIQVTYIIYADTGDTFTSEPLTIQGTTADTIFTIEELYPNTQYVWKVGVTDSKDTSYSEISMFTTAKLKPILLSPDDSVTGVSITVPVSWTCEVPQGLQVSYVVFVDTGSNEPLTVEGITSDTVFIIEGLHLSTTYKWKVAVIEDTDTSYSETRMFTTVQLEPILLLPADSAVDIDTNVLVSWSCQIPQGLQVSYIVFADTGTNEPLTVKGITSDTFYTIQGLNYNNEYLWRVGAHAGIDTAYSEIRSFTTISVPDSVLITLGTIGSMGVDTLKPVNGTIIASPAIDETALTIVITNANGTDITSTYFTQTGPANIVPMYEIDINSDLGLAFTPNNTIVTGIYRLTISATAGTATDSDYEEFTVTNNPPDLITVDITLGSYNSTVGASLEADSMIVYTGAEAMAISEKIDLWYSNTGDNTDALWSPYHAAEAMYPPNSWATKNQTMMAKVTVNFDAITTQAQIDSIWATLSLDPSDNDWVYNFLVNEVVILETNNGNKRLLKFVSGGGGQADSQINLKCTKQAEGIIMR